MCQKEPHIQCCQVEFVEELGDYVTPIYRSNGNVLTISAGDDPGGRGGGRWKGLLYSDFLSSIKIFAYPLPSYYT